MRPTEIHDPARAVDLERLERSLGLRARPLGGGRYRVDGGAGVHWVDLYDAAVPRCDCGDHLWRSRNCKHVLAALLREGDERVVRALGEMVREIRQAA